MMRCSPRNCRPTVCITDLVCNLILSDSRNISTISCKLQELSLRNNFLIYSTTIFNTDFHSRFLSTFSISEFYGDLIKTPLRHFLYGITTKTPVKTTDSQIYDRSKNFEEEFKRR